MIGQSRTDVDGRPVDLNGKPIQPAPYQPEPEIKELFARVQRDYQTAWLLQRKPLEEFDGYSLLDRSRLDQQTFAAYVGVEYVPKHKKWRWRGKRNTARNKLIGILSHMIAGMLFPFLSARNNRNEEDKVSARVMRILVEDALKNANGKRGYEITFLYMVLQALVNPATFVQVEFVEAMQNVKVQLANGTMSVKKIIDEFLSGLNVNVIPVDELLLGDLYCGTGAIQRQPFIVRLQRISYDDAKARYGGHPDFHYVKPGMTHWLQGDEQNTLFEVEWTEADANFVQVATFGYRQEDLEVPFCGGVFVGVKENVYMNNPMRHRRYCLIDDELVSVPLYEYAMSGFEPIDPAGRFVYYKSGAFKEYWDYIGENQMDALLMDGTKLDVFKPMFLSGIAKIDATVMVPGATVAMPAGANATPYALGPNLAAAIEAMRERQAALSESTQDKIMQGQTAPNITATQSLIAQQHARIFLGVFGLMIADLVKQIGELTVDEVTQNYTVGKLNSTVPESLAMQYRTILAQGKERGRDVTHRIVFTDAYFGRQMTKNQVRKREYQLFRQAGGKKDTDQYIWEVNPRGFIRLKYNAMVDADRMISRAMGSDRIQKDMAFEKLTDPRVAPFTDPEAVATEFVIEEYAEGDPERLKRKQNGAGGNDLLSAIMGNGGGGAPQSPGAGGGGRELPSPINATINNQLV